MNGCLWQALSTREEKVLIRKGCQRYVNPNANGSRGKLKRAGENMLYYLFLLTAEWDIGQPNYHP